MVITEVPKHENKESLKILGENKGFMCEKCNIVKNLNGNFTIRKLKHYYTYRKQCGPCRHLDPVSKEERDNWILEHGLEIKKCNTCHEEKYLFDFRQNQSVNIGVRPKCKKCSGYRVKTETDILNQMLFESTPQRKLQVYVTTCVNRGFTPNKELYWELMHKPCIYCNKQYIEGELIHKIPYEMNGVDRLDSSVGYTEENCVSCCSMCNYMKKDTDISSFIRKCCEIHRVESEDYRLKYHPGIILCGNSCDFKQYKYSSGEKGYSFDLSEEEFNDIVSKKCFYCNKTNEEGVIGVDRVDNSIGYNLRNCVPCCSYCNYMKNNYSLKEFLGKIEDIVNYTKDNEQIKNLCENIKKFKKSFGKK